jgi:antitoxin HicB
MCGCDDSGGLQFELILKPEPDGGFSVSSPSLPELIAYGRTKEEALNHAQESLGAILDLYEEQGRPLPGDLH